jgi:hypothetical protein
MKILFQGDSITDAFRKPEEINPAFQLGNAYAFLVAASLGLRHPEHSLNSSTGSRDHDMPALRLVPLGHRVLNSIPKNPNTNENQRS